MLQIHLILVYNTCRSHVIFYVYVNCTPNWRYKKKVDETKKTHTDPDLQTGQRNWFLDAVRGKVGGHIDKGGQAPSCQA